MRLFEAVVSRLTAGDLHGVAALCDPVSLRALHRQHLIPEDEDVPLKAYADADTEMRATPAEAFFARWLWDQSRPTRLVEYVANGWMSEAEASRQATLPPFDVDYEPLGVVLRSPDLALVVYDRVQRPHPRELWPESCRRHHDLLPADEQQLALDAGLNYAMIAACRRQGDGGWRVWADQNFLSLDNGLAVVSWPPEADGTG